MKGDDDYHDHDHNKQILISDSSGQIWEILPENEFKPNMTFKLVVIGNSGVGKSCLTKRGIQNIFEECGETIGFEYKTILFKRKEGEIIELQIWDTCGQEAYRSLISNFYRSTSLAIMVYSIDNEKSFNDLEIWIKELKMYSRPDAKVFVIGNKVDLEEQRKIDMNKASQFAKDYQLNLFMEASAKTGFNAQNIFFEAAKSLYNDYLKYKDLSTDSGMMNSMKSGFPSVASKTTMRTYDTGCSC